MLMVDLILNIPKAIRGQEDKFNLALPIVGAVLVTAAGKQLRANKSIVTGNLLNSLGYSTNKRQIVGGLNKPIGKLTLRWGTTVVYAPRVEFGFTGLDSLGRMYNQPAKSFLRVSAKSAKRTIEKLFVRVMK